MNSSTQIGPDTLAVGDGRRREWGISRIGQYLLWGALVTIHHMLDCECPVSHTVSR